MIESATGDSATERLTTPSKSTKRVIKAAKPTLPALKQSKCSNRFYKMATAFMGVVEAVVPSALPIQALGARASTTKSILKEMF